MKTFHANNLADTSRALIIFAKQPLPGAVKTRLVPPLTLSGAAGLYACMLQDTLQMAQTLAHTQLFIYYQDDPGAAGYFAALAPHIPAAPQRGGDLGERMRQAFTDVFGRGFREVAIIGSDSPDLPAEFVQEAFFLLGDGHTDVVFGPAADGGYYLLAMKSVRDELFADIPWSSAVVLARSREKAGEAGLGVALLPLWHDLDTSADLQRPALLAEKSPAARTGQFLRRLSIQGKAGR